MPQQLQAVVRTLKAEMTLSLCRDGKAVGSEHWSIVYRDPGEGLLGVFDAKGRLERSKYFRANETVVDAQGVHQDIFEGEPQAWPHVARFFDAVGAGAEIRESREVAPGLWVPSDSVTPPVPGGRRGALARQKTITLLQVNGDVSREFSARGR